jgi:hypothetical protein
VNLLPGDAASHAFVVNSTDDEAVPTEPLPPSISETKPRASETSHTASYVLWGVGAAGAVAATVLLFESNRMQEDADHDFARRCPTGASDVLGCENSTAADAKAANWRTASLVTGVGALGALVAGTLLYIFDAQSSSEADTADVFVKPWVSANGAGIAGRF